jgi:anti-sigma-K factor RskA
MAVSHIERYLLGRLPADERKRLEALVFEDEDTWSAVRDTEDDLIERYLGGSLSAGERRDFQRHFLASSSRRSMIVFARSLPGALRSACLWPPHPDTTVRARPQSPRP